LKTAVIRFTIHHRLNPHRFYSKSDLFMTLRNLNLFVILIALACRALAAPVVQERSDWAPFFSNADVHGTIVVIDARTHNETVLVHDADRAARRYSPASTFKIPHSLFVLDAGLLRDEFQVIPWDGIKRPTEAWNKDQNVRSAMRNSVVWVYERFARQLGDRRETEYMNKIGYGNAVTDGNQPFWVEGDLEISAHEQIAFLRRLYRNELPFREAHQRLVKDVMVNEAGQDWILRAKTGWSGKIGWWVGWVEWPTGPVFFALNIDTPRRLDDLAKRQDITRRILRSIGALPDTGRSLSSASGLHSHDAVIRSAL
jgi:beta-lactamase class D